MLRLRISLASRLRQLQSFSSPAKGKKALEGKYSHTVHLPKNTFDQRANAIKREPEIQQFWVKNQIYEKLSQTNTGDVYTLHDGPPYANGELHIGHALNKILKDIVNRFQLLKGNRVKYLPGWDCHGLPIELKVLQTLKHEEIQKLSPIELRKKAASFVHSTVESQRNAFKRYGVWGDWDTPYLTMQKDYEAAQISVFGSMVKKGLIYRGKKPVHWSPSSRTALAEAELEYPENHISRSVYAGFDIVQPSPKLQELLTTLKIPTSSTRIAIWTTTPWTLPANQAVAIREDLEYSLISHSLLNSGNLYYIIASELVDTFIQTISSKESQLPTLIHGKLRGSDLSETIYQHPLYTGITSRTHKVIIGGDYINTESGTGLVHTAPGHGAEDYLVGMTHGLPLLSPVDDHGNFTSEAGDQFSGKFVLTEGNEAVINSLTKSGHLLHEHAYCHKYPYDWRTKKPTIFRATEQWFASVDKPEYREEVLKAIDTVRWVPEIGKNRIVGTVTSRKDWCISRQRVWGVPIPVFYHKETKEPLITEETISHIEDIFRQHGSNAWWELSTEELLPPSMKNQAHNYECGVDSMDVWFDSGTSWAGVLSRKGLNYPADLYLEGSDQHRGWFQSSLLTSVAANNIAPYKTVLTHGFTLDEKGLKMSKSLGNVVDPYVIINGGSNIKENPPYGADTLRLWVAGVDYNNDVSVGPNILKNVSDSYRKHRNTLRFMIGSLDDFNPITDSIPITQMSSLNQNMLGQLTSLFRQVNEAYENYQFYRVIQLLTLFSNKTLSNFYFDISKDCLYISSSREVRRRACQTVLHHILHQYSLMIAPILPHLAEDVWQHYPSTCSTLSIFQQGWLEQNQQFPLHDMKKWELLSKLKDDVNYCLELARREKSIGASQECQVKIYLQPSSSSPSSSSSSSSSSESQELIQILRQYQAEQAQAETGAGEGAAERDVDDLKYILIVSKVILIEHETPPFQASTTPAMGEQENKFYVLSDKSESGLTIEIEKTNEKKCERCWFYCSSVGQGHAPDLCSRCDQIISQRK